MSLFYLNAEFDYSFNSLCFIFFSGVGGINMSGTSQITGINKNYYFSHIYQTLQFTA